MRELAAPSGEALAEEDETVTSDVEEGFSADLTEGLAGLSGLSLADPDAEEEDLDFPGTVEDEDEEI